MMDSIEVKICVGTYSYVMGGADLIDIESTFPDEWKGRVKVIGVLDLPGVEGSEVKPPYASVNGMLIAEATPAKVLAAIGQALQSGG